MGAALVRAGRVLAARRMSPPELAGQWEFPGGKVEPGEQPEDALARELAEELGVTVRVGEWLTPRVPIGESLELRVAMARLVDSDPEPTEHDELRWLAAEELGEVAWAAPDVPFLAEVAHALRTPLLRGIFFDEDDARAVAARLVTDGWVADVLRERLHGEDDEEDHPWAVVTDAPELILELLIDEHDGWLDVDDPAVPGAPVAPLDLPTAPKRVKRPEGH